MPSPLDSVSVQRQKFAAKGLDDHDLVTLVGMLSLVVFNERKMLITHFFKYIFYLPKFIKNFKFCNIL